MLNTSLGQRIKAYRMKQGFTQQELAQGICTPSMVSQIESDRANPSYKMLFAIAERLGAPLEKLMMDVDMGMEASAAFKMAKAMVGTQEYAVAIPLLLEVRRLPHATISETEILSDLAECYLHTNRLHEAEELLHHLQEMAIDSMDASLHAQTLLNFGLIEMKRKHFKLAIFHWQKSLEEADKMEHQDVCLKGNLCSHLGDVHERIGKLQEAILYFHQASEFYQHAGHLDRIANTYMQLGQSYKRIGEYEQAAQFSNRAITLYNGLEDTYMSIKVQLSTAIVYGQNGREEEAIQMLETVMAPLQALGKSDDIGIAYVELAKIHAAVGNFDAARDACQSARDLLPQLHPGNAWINRILGEVEIEQGHQEEGIRRLQMAADCFKRSGELGDWADTMSEISRHLYEQDDFLNAFNIMNDIRQYTHQVLCERGIVL